MINKEIEMNRDIRYKNGKWEYVEYNASGKVKKILMSADKKQTLENMIIGYEQMEINSIHTPSGEQRRIK